MHKKEFGLLSLPVIVAALGFFVDVFDLLLFGIVRKPSLRELGLSDEAILSEGELLLSVQMTGMMLGGIVWGILGDKKGRLKVLFGSILLYSIANIANGFVQTTGQYSIIRFIAGFGLAGELGAGITLTSEILAKEKRGLAATVIAVCGVLGGISAALLYSGIGDWRMLYFIGGGLGLALLILRIAVAESSMYDTVKKSSVQLGNFLQFFTSKERFNRYMRGILIGLPVWYIIGILVSFADQFGNRMGIAGVKPGDALMYQYIGLGLGDICAGLLSNAWKSRRKALFVFYAVTILFMILFFVQDHSSLAWFYFVCGGLGFGAGISVLYITTSAEQFGTNLRASASISITNMVRGFTPLMLLCFAQLRKLTDYVSAAWILGAVVMLIGIVALWFTEESFGKDLDFTE
ncbi:MAG: MFS transporter [Chitinophagales bacterium]|jgi:MFS family permease|nr:MFS transporter [Chitinophagales bacterium]